MESFRCPFFSNGRKTERGNLDNLSLDLLICFPLFVLDPAGFNVVPKIPDAQSFRCLFYPNGRKAESLNLALIWPVNDPPVELLAMKEPAEMTSWLRQRLPFLDLQESAARDILSQKIIRLRMVRNHVASHKWLDKEGGLLRWPPEKRAL